MFVLESAPSQEHCAACLEWEGSLHQVRFHGHCSLLNSADGSTSEGTMMTSALEIVARIVRANWTSLLILVALIAAWQLLQTRSTPLASIEEFDQRVQTGQPVAVYMFNNT